MAGLLQPAEFEHSIQKAITPGFNLDGRRGTCDIAGQFRRVHRPFRALTAKTPDSS